MKNIFFSHKRCTKQLLVSLFLSAVFALTGYAAGLPTDGPGITTRPMILGFQYNPNTEGKTSLILTASAPISYTAYKKETPEGGTKLILELSHMELGNFTAPISLFKYPVTTISPTYYPLTKTSSISFSLKEDADYEIIKEASERIIINFLVPDKTKEKEVVEEVASKYTGELISVDFEQADLVQTLRFLTDLSGKNVIISPNVKGSISIRLKNLPSDQVLDIILDSNSLEKFEDENFIRIGTLQEFSAERAKKAQAATAKAKMKKQIADSDTLITYLLPVSYTDINGLIAQLEDLKGANGTLRADTSTNQIIITDTATNIRNMKELAKLLDVRTKQVSIEVRMITIDTTAADGLGFNWSVTGSLGAGFGGQLSSVATVTDYLTTVLTPTTALNAAVAITAYERKQQAKTISNPKIFTSDNLTASISSGQVKQVLIPGTANNPPTFQSVTAEIKLDVTPHITLDGFIKMELAINNDNFVSPTVADINTQKVKTTLYVKDGYTAVIRGLFKETKTDFDGGVPGLASIPLLGFLFGAESSDLSSQELMIFITPKIVEDKGGV